MIVFLVDIAIAVFFVWRASESDDRGAMFLLFAAAFVIIHAHGARIYEAIKRQERKVKATKPCANTAKSSNAQRLNSK